MNLRIAAAMYSLGYLNGEDIPGIAELDQPSKLMLLFVGCASEIEDLPERYGEQSTEAVRIQSEYKGQIIEAASQLAGFTSKAEMETAERCQAERPWMSNRRTWERKEFE